MSVKTIVRQQYKDIVDQAAQRVKEVRIPSEGWIVTVRKALGLSATQLAERMAVTRANISNTERAEIEGGVSLKRMQSIAEAMGCRFVYAIVPNENVDDALHARAMLKAKRLVERAAQHMGLESQGLSAEQIAYEIERIAKELLSNPPRDFWKD